MFEDGVLKMELGGFGLLVRLADDWSPDVGFVVVVVVVVVPVVDPEVGSGFEPSPAGIPNLF